MINVSVLRTINGVKTRMPVVPVNSADAAKSGVVVYDPTDKTFRIGNEVISVEDLIVTGDIEVENDAMFRNDVSISGDLFVDGVEHINDSETVQTTGDYFILRHNNNTPLATGEHSGLAVFSYALNKTATLTVDKDGTWRIADNTASSTVHTNLYYFNGVYYDTSFVPQTFVDQIKTAFDEDEIAHCVLDTDTNTFYHFDGTHWFEVSLVNNHLVTDSTEITDATLIAKLEALTKYDLQYFRRLQITTIVEIENEPILTRDEAANMNEAGILTWDSTAQKAISTPAPTTTDQVLAAVVTTSGGVTTKTFNWKDGIFKDAGLQENDILAYDATNNAVRNIPRPTLNGQVLTYKEGNVAFDKHLITIDGVQYEEYPTTPFTGTIPSGVTQTTDTVTLSTQGTLYWSDSENAYFQEYEDVEHNTRWQKLNAFVYYEQDDEWNDGSTTVPAGNVPADIVATTLPEAYHYVKAAVADTYEWKTGGSGSVNRFATYAEAQAALAIPEGADGYLGQNAIVIIEDEDAYITGDER